ncbi:MAG: HIT family protein [Ktedonobacterales bacterium]
MDNCIFCRILAGQAPADIICETDEVMVFLSFENHPLVVPKAHIPNLYTLADPYDVALMRQTVRVARAVKAGLACDGVLIAQANEPAAGQDVFHLHIHVYPRWHGDRSIYELPPVRDVALRQARRERIAAALERG